MARRRVSTARITQGERRGAWRAHAAPEGSGVEQNRGYAGKFGSGRDAWPVQVASVPAYGATGRHDAGTESGGRREMIQWRFRK